MRKITSVMALAVVGFISIQEGQAYQQSSNQQSAYQQYYAPQQQNSSQQYYEPQQQSSSQQNYAPQQQAAPQQQFYGTPLNQPASPQQQPQNYTPPVYYPPIYPGGYLPPAPVNPGRDEADDIYRQNQHRGE